MFEKNKQTEDEGEDAFVENGFLPDRNPEPQFESEPLVERFESFNFEPVPFEEPEPSTTELEKQCCEHDSKYKHPQTIPQSAGTSIGGFGVSTGTGEVVLVCTKCEKIYGLEDARKDQQSFF